MGERAKGMLRARIQRNRRAIELGYFKTKAEIAAVQEVAHAIFDKWDEVKKPPKPFRLPSPAVLTEAINQGAYDVAIEAVAAVATKRHNLMKRLMTPHKDRYGTLENSKWQAIQKKFGGTPPVQQKDLGLDPPARLIG